MPLELTDFAQAGLEVDALALIVVGAEPDLYIGPDRGGTQAPEAGELGLGTAETRIAMIRLLSGNRIALGDANLPAMLSLADFFGAAGESSPWALYVQTDDGLAWTNQIHSSAGDVVRMQFTAADAAVLYGIDAGDRVIFAVVRTPRSPMAALAASETIIEQGRSVELRWVISDAVSAELDNGIAASPLRGGLRVSPQVSTAYTLTATGAAGTTPATATVTVTVTARRQRSLLPPNATPLERGMELAARQPIDLPIRKLWSPSDCPVALLPYLAWALGVEDWDSDWPAPVKRAAVAQAAAIHREKGTLAGLKRLLDTSGADYEYVERPAGVPMTARLSIFNSNVVYLPDIGPAIERVKRASLDLEIVLAASAAGTIPIRGGLGGATFVEISDWGPYA